MSSIYVYPYRYVSMHVCIFLSTKSQLSTTELSLIWSNKAKSKIINKQTKYEAKPFREATSNKRLWKQTWNANTLCIDTRCLIIWLLRNFYLVWWVFIASFVSTYLRLFWLFLFFCLTLIFLLVSLSLFILLCILLIWLLIFIFIYT